MILRNNGNNWSAPKTTTKAADDDHRLRATMQHSHGPTSGHSGRPSFSLVTASSMFVSFQFQVVDDRQKKDGSLMSPDGMMMMMMMALLMTDSPEREQKYSSGSSSSLTADK